MIIFKKKFPFRVFCVAVPGAGAEAQTRPLPGSDGHLCDGMDVVKSDYHLDPVSVLHYIIVVKLP